MLNNSVIKKYKERYGNEFRGLIAVFAFFFHWIMFNQDDDEMREGWMEKINMDSPINPLHKGVLLKLEVLRLSYIGNG